MVPDDTVWPASDHVTNSGRIPLMSPDKLTVWNP
jgi:hypothetical protein